MLKKQFSSTDPFKRLKPQIRYLIGGKGSNQPIQILNYTLKDFNTFVDSVDKISGEGSGRVKIYYNANEALVKSLGKELIKNWFSIDSIKSSKTGGEHVSFDLKGGNLKDGTNESRLERCRDYLNKIVTGGHITEMLKSVPDGEVVSSSKYGRQANGNTYMFSTKQVIPTDEDVYDAENKTNQDVNQDGYVGDPADGKKAKDSKEDEDMSFTTILFIMAAVLVVALLLKKNK